jgi:hypothetical protein
MSDDADDGGAGEEAEEGEAPDEELPDETSHASAAAEREHLEDERGEILYYALAIAAGAGLFHLVGLPFYFGAAAGLVVYLLIWYYFLP